MPPQVPGCPSWVLTEKDEQPCSVGHGSVSSGYAGAPWGLVVCPLGVPEVRGAPLQAGSSLGPQCPLWVGLSPDLPSLGSQPAHEALPFHSVVSSPAWPDRQLLEASVAGGQTADAHQFGWRGEWRTRRLQSMAGLPLGVEGTRPRREKQQFPLWSGALPTPQTSDGLGSGAFGVPW